MRKKGDLLDHFEKINKRVLAEQARCKYNRENPFRDYNKSRRKLTAVEERKIIRLRGSGMSYRKISDAINNKISYVSIYDFLNGKTYK